MKSKKIKGVVIATVATVAGVFGGLKLYAAKKDRNEAAHPIPETKEEQDQ